jgi:hypothetical protein
MNTATYCECASPVYAGGDDCLRCRRNAPPRPARADGLHVWNCYRGRCDGDLYHGYTDAEKNHNLHYHGGE